MVIIAKGVNEYGLSPKPTKIPAIISRDTWNPPMSNAASKGVLPISQCRALLNCHMFSPSCFAVKYTVIVSPIHSSGLIIYDPKKPPVVSGRIVFVMKYITVRSPSIKYHISDSLIKYSYLNIFIKKISYL